MAAKFELRGPSDTPHVVFMSDGNHEVVFTTERYESGKDSALNAIRVIQDQAFGAEIVDATVDGDVT